MLEYLLSFISENMIFIVIVFLTCTAISFFSKVVRIVFSTFVGLVITYFGLLVLYVNGIGNETLYNFSIKYIYILCNLFESVSRYFEQLYCVFNKNVLGINNLFLIINLFITLAPITYIVFSYYKLLINNNECKKHSLSININKNKETKNIILEFNKVFNFDVIRC